MAGPDGSDTVQERFLLRVAVVPAAAPTVRVLRVATGAEACGVGLDEVPDAISALLVRGEDRPAWAAAARRTAHRGVQTLPDAEARVEVRLDRPVIRQGDSFTIEIALALNAESIARPTARCAVWVGVRPIDRQPRARNADAADHGVVCIGRPGSALFAGRYRLETVVQLTELRAGQVCHRDAGFVESLLVVSPALG